MIPFKHDESGEYVPLRTGEGLFELRPEDTVIFEPSDISLRGLRHVFHIVDEDEDKYTGLHLWKSIFENTEWDYEEFVQDLAKHGYDTQYFSEPDPYDLRAYQKHHGEPFVPETLEQIMDNHEPSHLFERIVELATRNFDDAWKWYSEEWDEKS